MTRHVCFRLDEPVTITFGMRPTPEWYEATLSRQLRANAQTWKVLTDRGASERSELRLDFLYWAPERAEAETLRAFLSYETDYELAVGRTEDRSGRAAWAVEGRTQPMSLNPEILDEWVTWMVVAGAENGRCEFAGWGAQLPG